MTTAQVIWLAIPLLLLLGTLLAGRYPGEERIAAYAKRDPLVRLPRAVARCAAGPPLRRAIPRGGRLIAFALAGRGPPSFAA